MRFEIAAASLLAATAAAFNNTSPFVVFSTSRFQTTFPEDNQLQSAPRVLRGTQDNLASCPTSRYVLVAQPGVHATDLRHPATGACLSPRLCEAAMGPDVRGRLDVAEVVGAGMSLGVWADYLSGACADRKDGFVVEEHELGALPVDKELRSARLAENDVKLGKIFSDAASSSGGDYTVIYFSPGHEDKTYESEYVKSPAIEMELKRRTGDVAGRRAAGGAGDISNAPLFVKYQFFTPGIFMGLVGVVIMLAILYVGLSAVSSLQVSYGAFDKEMGPAAQKKNI